MILAATHITTASGHQSVADHVLRGADNISITVLQGVEADLEDMATDAAAHGSMYAIRHYHMDPDQPITRDQVFEALRLVAAEFGFDADKALVVEHRKPRANGGADGRGRGMDQIADDS